MNQCTQKSSPRRCFAHAGNGRRSVYMRLHNSFSLNSAAAELRIPQIGCFVMDLEIGPVVDLEIEDILPLSPLQEGFLFHASYDEGSPDVYVVQIVLTLEGRLDAAA